MKKLICMLLALAMALLCAPFALAEEGAALDLSEYFSDRDLSGAWKEKDAQRIGLNGQTAVTIDAAGVYVLSGSMTGSVTVNAGDQDKVQLVLSGADIAAEGSAAILVENADKVFITLAEGTSNSLSASGLTGENGIDGAVFSRDDITLNGSGGLTVTSDGHGIVGKDDVRITGGTYSITAAARGIDANDSVRISGGRFAIVSGKDAIRARSDESDKGYILIAGGSFDLNAGGGAESGQSHTEDRMRDFRGSWGGSASSADTDTVSAKGIKASGQVLLYDGEFAISSADDGVHSDGDVTVYGGNLTIASGDDGMHADHALTIQAGDVAITRSYEGLEAAEVVINGGNIRVTASDDGINSSGGSDQSGFRRNDMFASDGSSITINGGSLYINAQGDGIDSNGDLTVTGGAIVVSGPTNGGNGALDYNGSAVITGGTVIAAGAVGMAENFGSGSTQVSILANLTGSAGAVTVKDSAGNTILSGQVEKNYQCVVVSSPSLRVGSAYTISGGGSSTEVTPSATVSGGGSGFGGGFGGGQRPDGGFGRDRRNNNGQTPNDQTPGGQRPGGGRR